MVILSPALWHRYVKYPALDRQLAALQAKRRATSELTHLNYYKGVLHTHCFWSHDSEGTLNDILPAAKKVGLDFVFFSDHPHASLDTFPRPFLGKYDGILMQPGSEKRGLLLWPLSGTVIDWRDDQDTIIRGTIAAGGMVFYAHTEEPHDWNNPDYQGMEIYNLHTDSEDENLPAQIINFAIIGETYRHWSYRELFDRQTRILALWDSLNTIRRIVGISAVDAHENQNIRARYLPDGRVEWVGPNANAIDTTNVGFLESFLLSKPDASGWAFKWSVDTYYHSFNYVTNYLLADSLEIDSLRKHLLAGHTYTAFKSLADASGFLFYTSADAASVTAILGDSVSVDQVAAIRAQSPLPCRFRLIRNGDEIDVIADSYQYSFAKAISPGTYRIELDLSIDSEWLPWIYSNPIYIVE